jgi:catechol 2,3-dioxygenase-like lactoylglutathione lyase family enzyme
VITVHGLHHVKVPVSDLTRSRAWYETVLSLSPHLEFPDDSGAVRGVAYQPLGNLTLCLREDPPRAQALAGFNPLAVLVATRADLDDIAAHLDQHGVSHGPVLTATLGWLLSAVDPDRIELRFYTAEHHPPMPVQGGGIAAHPIPAGQASPPAPLAGGR